MSEYSPPTLNPLDYNTHKNQQGTLLLVAGSRGMSGACILASQAALRSGSGLVYAAIPASINDLVEGAQAEVITLAQDDKGEGYHLASQKYALTTLANEHHVLCLGPGMGRNPETVKTIRYLIRHCQKPLVLDADGLNALAENIQLLKRRESPTVLTPHLGEFSRLTGLGIEIIEANREAIAKDFAKHWQVTLVLKGPNSIITDGDQVHLNSTGNPGMASAGCGDVLTGVIGSLIGQGLSAFEAAKTGVWIHGHAADLAAKILGERSLLASDIVSCLPQAVRICVPVKDPTSSAE